MDKNKMDNNLDKINMDNNKDKEFLEFKDKFLKLKEERENILCDLESLKDKVYKYDDEVKKYVLKYNHKFEEKKKYHQSLINHDKLIEFKRVMRKNYLDEDAIDSFYKYLKINIFSNEILNELNESIQEDEKLFVGLRFRGGSQSRNNLFLDVNEKNYLINKRLMDLLLNRDVKIKKVNSFYIVIFNKITLDKKHVLIYNYLEYNIEFIDLFYAYLLLEYKLSRKDYSKGKDYLCLVDDNLIENFRLNNYSVTKNFDLKNRINYNIINLLQDGIFDDRGILHKDLNQMGDYICNITKCDILPIIYDIYGDNVDVKLIHEKFRFLKNKENMFLLPKFLFVVSDLDSFINIIKEKGFENVNQGPQKYRGRVNSLSNKLFLINNDFIDSIGLHHFDFIQYNTRLKKGAPYSAFSFNNINIKLGNIRWYSVGRNINKDTRLMSGVNFLGVGKLLCRGIFGR